jgi:branched-chain amino acid transport system substrate-binding protein
MLAVLLVVGLVVGTGIGYFMAPSGEGEVVEVEVPVEVEVHPLAGDTIQWGVTSSSTTGLETTMPLVEDIIQPDLNDYAELMGLDIEIDLLVEDNQGTAAIALEKTQTYKAMGINIVQGHGWSSQCGAALSYVNENDMILVSASSTSPLYAIPNDMLFRTCPTDFVQGPAIATMFKTWGIEAVLTMHRADAWGDGIWNVLEPLWEPAGIEDLGRIRYAGEVTEFSSYLAQADTIITEAIATYGIERVGMQFFSFDEIRTIQTQAADYPNLLGIIWMGTESGGRSELMLDEAGDLAVQTRHFSSLMGADEANFQFQSLDTRYLAETERRASFYTGTSYDSNWMILKSILATGQIGAAQIAEMFIDLSYQHHGTTGWVSLDANGDRQAQLFDIWGFYVDPDTGENTFQKWGKYDGQAIDVTWDDAAVTRGGLTRPALGG